MEKLKNVNPQVYYRSLGKKEKSQFLQYLATRYGMKVNTIRRKLAINPISDLTKLEEITIRKVIEESLWKK